MRALRREQVQRAQFERGERLDHHVARQLAVRPKLVGGELHDSEELDGYKYFVNVCYRYCGSVAIWVGYATASNTFEARIEGYPTVSDIVMRVRNPSSTKSLTRAARYALLYLELHMGVQVFGAVKLGDSYDVRVSPPLGVRG